MTRRGKLAALVSTLSFGLFSNACAQEVRGHAGLAGRWGGALGSGPGALRLVLEIAPDQPIVLVSVDQGNGRIPATGGTCTASEIDLQFGAVRGRLKLVLNAQGVLTGTWSQGQEQPVTFTRLVAGQAPVVAPPAPIGDLQTEVDAARARSGAPAIGGAFIGIAQGRTTSGEAASGVLVNGEAPAVGLAQKWHIGSITKSMTATLVARLVERGLLSWDMKLGDAFNDMAPNMVAAYRNVTLAQLMSGRSGMPTNIPMSQFSGHASGGDSPTQKRKLWVRQALAMRPENAPGAGFVYPNNGYVLAGALCEKVSGKAYEALMQDEVFGPLGLSSAGFGAPAIGNPQGHRKSALGGRLISVGVGADADNPAPMSPAGRAHMSLPDLAKFALAHSEGHQGLRNSYLRQETWRFLHTPPVRTPQASDYAFGWLERPDKTLWHNGSNTYWMAEVAFDPAKSVSACACANYAETAPAVARILAVGMAKASA